MALANLNIHYTGKNIQSEYNNNKSKISAPTWNDTFDLPEGCYSISDIQDYFEFIIEKHKALTENPSAQIYVNQIKNRFVFKIKRDYKLELIFPKTMTLLRKTKKDVAIDKDSGNGTKFEYVEIVLLVHYNLVKDDYQHTSKVLFTFVPNKQFRQLINILVE